MIRGCIGFLDRRLCGRIRELAAIQHGQILAQVLGLFILWVKGQAVGHGIQRRDIVLLPALRNRQVEPVIRILRIHLDHALEKCGAILTAAIERNSLVVQYFRQRQHRSDGGE